MDWSEPEYRDGDLLNHWERLLWKQYRDAYVNLKDGRQPGWNKQWMDHIRTFWHCLSTCEALIDICRKSHPSRSLHTAIALLFITDWSKGRAAKEGPGSPVLDADLTLFVDCIREAFPDQAYLELPLSILQHFEPVIFRAHLNKQDLFFWLERIRSEPGSRPSTDDYRRGFEESVARVPLPYPEFLSEQ